MAPTNHIWVDRLPAEILFVDPGTPDLGTVFRSLRPGVEAVLLDGTEPAARQIARALAGRRDLAAVHIMAHGAPGRVSFTAGDWAADTLEAEADDFAAIGRALAADGDLRLWSCQAGAGRAGADFVERLAEATGADVAAATGLVGLDSVAAAIRDRFTGKVAEGNVAAASAAFTFVQDERKALTDA